jgi:hypothetical protein
MEIMTVLLATKEVGELLSIGLGIGSLSMFSKIYKEKSGLISGLCDFAAHGIGISYCTIKTMSLIKYILIICCLL